MRKFHQIAGGILVGIFGLYGIACVFGGRGGLFAFVLREIKRKTIFLKIIGCCKA